MKYFLLFLMAPVAHANEPKEQEPKVVYKQRTEIDFEGVEVDGELVKPQGTLLMDRKRASFNSMVWIRTDFDDEMDKTIKEIK